MESKSAMTTLVVNYDLQTWNVWISLPDHDPLTDDFGFVIGTGKTRDKAVAQAVHELETIIERLQVPAGLINKLEQYTSVRETL